MIVEPGRKVVEGERGRDKGVGRRRRSGMSSGRET
jgi:hypothetical protein